MSDIRRWSLVAANNNFAVPDGFPENMPRSETNNAAREMMRAIRLWYDDPEWLDLMVDTAGDPLTISFVSTTVVRVEDRDMTSYFPVGRLVRVSVGGASITYGYVVSAVFGTHTDVTLENMFGAGTVIPAGVDTLDVHHSSTLGKLAFQDAIDLGFYVPETADDEGIQGAVDAANAAGGGIVLMTDDAYTVDSTVTVKSNVVVYGAEFSSTTVTAAAGLVGQVFMMSDSSSLIGLTINTSAQVAASEAVRVGAGVTEVYLRGLYIIQAQTHGVMLSGAGISRVFMGDLWIEDPGQSGVYIDDNGNDNDEIVLANVSVRDPGNDGSTIDVYGVRLAGKCVASNIHVTCDRASPQKQRGVYFASRNDSGLVYARQCKVTNLRVEGSGNQAIGAEIGGSGNSVVGGTMNLTGTSSRGILIDNIGAAQVSDFHTVSDITVTDADIGIQVSADSDDNLIANCSVLSANTTSAQVTGERNRFTGCYFSGGTSPSVQLVAGAVENEFDGCTIDRGGTGEGFNIPSGSTGNSIKSSTIRDCADGVVLDGDDNHITGCTFIDCTDGIVEGADSQGNVIFGCVFRGVTNVVQNYDTRNLWDDNTATDGAAIPRHRNSVFVTLESDVADGVSTPETIAAPDSYDGLQIPGPTPDASMWWKFEVEGTYSWPASRTVDLKLWTNTTVSLTAATLLQSLRVEGTGGVFRFGDGGGGPWAVQSTAGTAVQAPDGVGLYYPVPSGHRYFFLSWVVVSGGASGATFADNSTECPIYGVSDAYSMCRFIGNSDMQVVNV